MAVSLSRLSLASLPASVATPTYRRADLKPGVVHFGVGNFHRAHQAAYFDELFAEELDLDWAIVGAGVRDADVLLREKLEGQDWLTTVVAQEAASSTARVIGSMVDFIKPFETEALLDALIRPEIRIVSLTITEGGYFISPATQKFDAGAAAIVADAKDIEAPKTVFGFIVEALRRRRAMGLEPFTVMSCDNIPGNGHVAENAVAGLAELVDPKLADWIRAQVAFPNSMVDRITPATTDRERKILAEDFGVDDAWPVFCEDFRQWVLEDKFRGGRPALERVGVEFVGDVAPYELMKIRILNGGHAAIAYPAALMDIHFVHEAIADGEVLAFLNALTEREILPVTPPPPGVDLKAYAAKIVERFANPKIADTIPRLCFDGFNRQPKFILPSARDRLKAGASVAGLALVSAAWCRYCYGVTDKGTAIAPNDPVWERLQAAAKAARSDPRAFLSLRDAFGDLADRPAYVEAFSRALQSLWSKGVRATLCDYVAERL